MLLLLLLLLLLLMMMMMTSVGKQETQDKRSLDDSYDNYPSNDLVDEKMNGIEKE
jgi:hypothetical protein